MIMDTQRRVTELALDIISPPSHVRKAVLDLHQAGERWIEHEGLQGIKRLKQIFDYLLDYLLGQPVEIPTWLKKGSSGHPIHLEPLIDWSTENPKWALTLVRLHELYQDKLTDEKCLEAMETITSPDVADNNQEYIEVILDEAKSLSVDRLTIQLGSVPMFTKGPNGVSLFNVHRDARAHHRYGTVPVITELGERIASLDDGVKISKVSSDMLAQFNDPDGSEELARVVFLSEKGGKVRVIAQGDYITQSTLKPIHDTVNGILRKIECDYTFDQDAGKRWMINATSKSKWLASYDLSAATDRLPVKLQASILDNVLPGKLGSLWMKTIIDRDFLYTLPSGKTGAVRYSVGQPMGFYSSFPAFALMHHLVVRAAYRLSHKGAPVPKHKFYAIIGDDMVIRDKVTGEMYLKIMRSIGAVINLKKSRLSNTAGVTIGEFAKCWAINGKNITPFSLRATRSALQNWSQVPEYFHRLRETIGVTPKAKKLKFILQKYWPKEANTLIRLIPVPHELGGFGKPDHHPIRQTLRGEHGNVFRLFLADKAYAVYRKTINISDDSLTNEFANIAERSRLRVAMEPLLSLIRDRGAKVGLHHVLTSRKSFILWALSDETSLSTLMDWIDLLKTDLPLSLRETLANSSLGWIKALRDDKKLSSTPIDGDQVLDFAIQQWVSKNSRMTRLII